MNIGGTVDSQKGLCLHQSCLLINTVFVVHVVIVVVVV